MVLIPGNLKKSVTKKFQTQKWKEWDNGPLCHSSSSINNQPWPVLFHVTPTYFIILKEIPNFILFHSYVLKNVSLKDKDLL